MTMTRWAPGRAGPRAGRARAGRAPGRAGPGPGGPRAGAAMSRYERAATG